MSRPFSSQRLLRAWWGLGVILLAGLAFAARGAEVMPPTPTQYFNDYAQVVSASVASGLNRELADFERTTSNQLVVAIFPTMETDSSLEDYTQRIFVAWKVGQKDRNNGAVLFVFLKEHKVRIQTGYGLEGALPDITCKRIIEDEMSPRFRQSDYAGGLTAGIHAMMAATRGEYQGTAQNAKDSESSSVLPLLFLLLVIAIFFFSSRQTGSGTSYARSGRSGGSGPSGCLGFLLGMLSSGAFRGGGYGAGGSFGGGGDGGGFTGGGGESGGGGASGSW